MTTITNGALRDKKLIGGGMGVNVSDFHLAREISRQPQCLGNVSGVALGPVFALGLQDGNTDYLEALKNFPFKKKAKEIFDAFYIEKGNPKSLSRRGIPTFGLNPSPLAFNLTVCANFAAIWLAKRGHNNQIGINYLTEIADSQIAATFGALLAGVDVITMGAGFPYQVPELLKALVDWKIARYSIPVNGGIDGRHIIEFDPTSFCEVGDIRPILKMPEFLPIFSSHVPAMRFASRYGDVVSGLSFERFDAGGHNAPPRDRILDSSGQPVYGPRDEPDLDKIRQIGLPFWFGGGRASPEGLAEALELGATGIQVGSAFAFCEESGLNLIAKAWVREHGYIGDAVVRADPNVSPTGYPFEIMLMPGTTAMDDVYNAQVRVCEFGVLLHYYMGDDGKIHSRCPAGPIDSYLNRGGNINDTVGKRCLCGDLLSAASMRTGAPMIITSGKNLNFLRKLMKNAKDTYRAKDVIEYIFSLQKK